MLFLAIATLHHVHCIVDKEYYSTEHALCDVSVIDTGKLIGIASKISYLHAYFYMFSIISLFEIQ